MASYGDKNGLVPGKTRILTGGILLFFMGILSGALVGTLFYPGGVLEEGSDEGPLVQDNNAVEIVSTVRDTTLVEWITYFSACGHECVLSDRESAVGMTADKLAETYKDYEVRLFSEEHVKLKREYPTWCPEHFVLMMEEGELCVKKTDPETMLPYRVVTLSFSADMFSGDERKMLETGMPFDSLVEINTFFEGLDS